MVILLRELFSPHSTKCSVMSVLPPPLSGCICLLAQMSPYTMACVHTHTHTQILLLCIARCLSFLLPSVLFHCYLPPYNFSSSLFPDTATSLGVLQVICFSVAPLRGAGGTSAGFAFMKRLRQTEDILPRAHTHIQ